MSSWTAVSFLIYLAHALLLPPLLIGFVRTCKARLQNRQGPSVFQPFWDLAKLLRKGETVSETATWAFRYGPIVCLGAIMAASLMLPWLAMSPPLNGDLFLFIYILALGRFALSLVALDTGSAFGALGASREAAISVQAEPAAVIALAALATHARSSTLSTLLAPGQSGTYLFVIVPLIFAALWLAAMAELARMPIDDPTTHLELTMIHEALLLENSGRNLAVLELASGLKMAVYFGLMAQVLLVAWPPFTVGVGYLLSIGIIFACGAVVAIGESVLVKLRWRKIPNLLSFAVAAGALACLVVAMKG